MAINIIVDLVDSDADRIITEGGGGGGVSDGDKGDIVVSGGGTVWEIDAGVVTTNELGGDITTAGKNLLDDANAAAQRTTLGLGTAATTEATDYATAVHVHAGGDITSGTVDPARLGSGTPSAATFLRGDSVWTTVIAAVNAEFGDGSDGSVTFDGATTILGMVPAANVYTMTRDFFFDAPVINTGVSVTGPYRFLAKTSITGSGKIHRNGNNGGNGTAGAGGGGGAQLVAGSLPASGSGGSGVNGNVAGNVGSSSTGCPQGYTAAGGAGGAGTGAGGAGGTCTALGTASGGWRVASAAVRARALDNTLLAIGGGGGGGGGTTGTPSGGGGGTGGWVVVCAPTIATTITIEANGGNGGNAFAGASNSGGGGGGKGGIAIIVTAAGGTTPAVFTANGGTGGLGNLAGGNGNVGGAGIAISFVTGA